MSKNTKQANEIVLDLKKEDNKVSFGTVLFTHIENPFDIQGSTKRYTDIHGQPLSKYLPQFNMGMKYQIAINNKFVDEDFNPEKYIVQPYDEIRFTPIQMGGGGGVKQVVTIVAMIALTIVAPMAGAYLATGVWSTAGLTALSGTALFAGIAYTAGIMVAGSLLINSIMTPNVDTSMPTVETTSNTYSWTGVETNRNINTVIPVLYGTHVLGGTVINNRFYYDEDNDWIGIQLALCQGKIEKIKEEHIYINDNTYSSYLNEEESEDIYYEYREGTHNQSIMLGFDDSTYNNIAVARKLSYNEPYTFQSTSTNVNYFRVHFEFPKGLYTMDKQGNKSSAEVEVKLEYRKVGDTSWNDFTLLIPNYITQYRYEYSYGLGQSKEVWANEDKPYIDTGLTDYGGFKIDTGLTDYDGFKIYARRRGGTRIVIDEENPEIVSNIITFSNSSSTAYKIFYEPYRDLNTPLPLEAGQYEFRATRLTEPPYDDNDEVYEDDPYNQNTCYIRLLEEIQTTDLNYGGIALLGLNIKATDQLSNSRPNFKVIATRKDLEFPFGNRASDNPAWICYDILTNKDYGMGLSETGINFKEFERWANFCEESTTLSNYATNTLTVPNNNLIKYYLESTNTYVDVVPYLTLNAVTIPNLTLKNIDRDLSTLSIQGYRNGVETTFGVSDIVFIEEYFDANNFLMLKIGFNGVLKPNETIHMDLHYGRLSPKLAFNGVLDTTSDVWNTLQEVAQVGRGQIILQGTKYSVIFDEPKLVTGLYNSANSKNVQVNYIGRTDVANEIEITYTDKDINYEMNVVSIQDSDATASNTRSNKTSKQVKGITSEEEALVMGRYLLATSKFLRKVVTFDADIEAITQTVGDLIALQTDVTQYGKGGLITKVFGGFITLDDTVTLEKGKTYSLKIKSHKTDEIIDYEFIAQDTNPNETLTFDRFPNTQVGTLTFEDFTIIVDFENEQYLETNMIYVENGYSIEVEDRYTFGEKNSDSLLCTITDISREGDLTRKITAIEYNESILDFDYDNDILQRIEPTLKLKNELSNLVITDRLVKLSSNQTVAMLSLSWDSKTSGYYNIYLLENGFKNYLATNIRSNRYEYPAVDLFPEIPYDIYIEDAEDSGIVIKQNYTITSFSSPPDDIESFTITPLIDSLRIDINYPNKPLDFSYYRVLYNSQEITKAISETIEIPARLGSQEFQYTVIAVDSIKKESNPLVNSITIEKPDIANVTFNVENEYVRLEFNTIKGSYDIDYYEIVYNNITHTTKENFIDILADWTGSNIISVVAFDKVGNASEVNNTDITITVPKVSNLTTNVEGKELVISWTPPTTNMSIDYYEIEYDSIITKTKSNTFRLPIYWGGNKDFSVKVVNTLGNYSSAVSTSVNIIAPTIGFLQTEVIDNNVLFRWEGVEGSLPIDNYQLYKGEDINNLTVIGKKNGTFTTVFENEAGTYNYWLSAIDSAGNEGVKFKVSTIVSEPPDYVLNILWESDFSGTKSNAKLANGNLYLPINTSESIQQHFTNNSWTTPQDQLNAGYDLWVEPFELNGYYEEVFDYGTILASSLVTMILDTTNVQGSPTLNTTISISADGVSYTDYNDQYQVYGTGFRYVKVRISVSGTDSLLELSQLSIKLDSKIKNDSGSGVAVSTDVGGTTVSFNKSFVDITSITVTPNSTTPMYAIYDFNDIPNPTQFKVLLYDNNGNRVNGNFSWSARGY